MRIIRLSVATLVFVALLSIFVVGDRLRDGDAHSLQAPPAETIVPETPAVHPTPEPTGIDTLPPRIVSIELSPSFVDTTASKQPLTVTVHITDELSGLAIATLRFVPEQGGTQYLDFQISVDDRVSGDRRDGIYVATADLAKYAADGRWYLVGAVATDNTGNSCGDYSIDTTPVILRLNCTGLKGRAFFINVDDNGESEPLPPDGTPLENEEKTEMFLPMLRD